MINLNPGAKEGGWQMQAEDVLQTSIPWIFHSQNQGTGVVQDTLSEAKQTRV